MKSSRANRQRLMIPSYIATLRPDVPATFESLSDDPLTTVLEFVGRKSYRSFGSVNKRCKEVYLLSGMKKKTFLFGYAPLSVIIDRYERDGELGWDLLEAMGKAVVFYNRSDVMDWALKEQKRYVLKRICNVAGEEGRLDILNEVSNNMDNEYEKEYIFRVVDSHAAESGKLDVLKWYETKGLYNINVYDCAKKAAYGGQTHIIQWLREEKRFELTEYLYGEAIDGGQLHVMKWLREQEVPWVYDDTFWLAAREGNLAILQFLHDEDCPWPEDICIRKRLLKPEALAWLRVNGYSDRII